MPCGVIDGSTSGANDPQSPDCNGAMDESHTSTNPSEEEDGQGRVAMSQTISPAMITSPV